MTNFRSIVKVIKLECRGVVEVTEGYILVIKKWY